jgi:hypothetical protein
VVDAYSDFGSGEGGTLAVEVDRDVLGAEVSCGVDYRT